MKANLRIQNLIPQEEEKAAAAVGANEPKINQIKHEPLSPLSQEYTTPPKLAGKIPMAQ